MDGQGSAAGGGGSACWVICELIGWDGFGEDRWPHLVISATVSAQFPVPRMFTGCLLGFTQLIQACDSDFPAETVAPLRNVTLFFEAQHVHSKKKN